MMIGPGDKRAMRDTGKTWTDSKGRVWPIMVDGHGNEHRVIRGSVKDITDPTSALNDMIVDVLADRLALELEDEGDR